MLAHERLVVVYYLLLCFRSMAFYYIVHVTYRLYYDQSCGSSLQAIQ